MSSTFIGVVSKFRSSVSALSQCSTVPFRGVSIVLGVFRCSGGVPLFRRCSVVQRVFLVPVFHCSVFRCCSVVQWVFRVPVFRWCSVVPRVFRIPSFCVPVFLVLQYDQNKELLQTAKDISTPLLLAQFNKRQICFNIPKMGAILYFKEYQFISTSCRKYSSFPYRFI